MTITGSKMQLSVSRQSGLAIVQIVGAASISEAEKLRITLEKLADERLPVIVLDLSQMEFICSLGLGAIISAHLRCRHHQGQIRLVKPTHTVRELLETTRLTKLFTIYDSFEAALK